MYFNTFKKSRLKTIAYTLGLVSLCFTIALGLRNTKPAPLVVIDLSRLVHAQTMLLIGAYPQGQVPQAVLKQTVDHLKNKINDFAHQHHIQILNKAQVLSDNFPDYTTQFSETYLLEQSRAGATQTGQDER
jgi:hypothetical protein